MNHSILLIHSFNIRHVKVFFFIISNCAIENKTHIYVETESSSSSSSAHMSGNKKTKKEEREV